MPRQYTPRVPRVCENPQCGKTFFVVPSRLRFDACRFCSPDCQHKGAKVPIADRFWSKVQKTDGCWLWTAGKDDKGYGMIGRGGKDGGNVGAHRMAWELTYGPIPDGLEVMHDVCDNPPCCNPAHLKLGTHAENMASMARKGRSALGVRNGNTTRPECRATGDRHGSRTHPESRTIGERNAMATLTEQDVRNIRIGFDEGEETAEAIAFRYGVSKASISLILRGLTWKHVDPPCARQNTRCRRIAPLAQRGSDGRFLPNDG